MAKWENESGLPVLKVSQATKDGYATPPGSAPPQGNTTPPQAPGAMAPPGVIRTEHAPPESYIVAQEKTEMPAQAAVTEAASQPERHTPGESSTTTPPGMKPPASAEEKTLSSSDPSLGDIINILREGSRPRRKKKRYPIAPASRRWVLTPEGHHRFIPSKPSKPAEEQPQPQTSPAVHVLDEPPVGVIRAINRFVHFGTHLHHEYHASEADFQELHHWLRQHRLEHDVYTGISLEHKSDKEHLLHQLTTKGHVLELKNLTSTTTEPDHLGSYTHGPWSVYFRFTGNTPGKDISTISLNPHEKESLIPPKERFQILGTVRDGETWFVTLGPAKDEDRFTDAALLTVLRPPSIDKHYVRPYGSPWPASESEQKIAPEGLRGWMTLPGGGEVFVSGMGSGGDHPENRPVSIHDHDGNFQDVGRVIKDHGWKVDVRHASNGKVHSYSRQDQRVGLVRPIDPEASNAPPIPLDEVAPYLPPAERVLPEPEGHHYINGDQPITLEDVSNEFGVPRDFPLSTDPGILANNLDGYYQELANRNQTPTSGMHLASDGIGSARLEHTLYTPVDDQDRVNLSTIEPPDNHTPGDVNPYWVAMAAASSRFPHVLQAHLNGQTLDGHLLGLTRNVRDLMERMQGGGVFIRMYPADLRWFLDNGRYQTGPHEPETLPAVRAVRSDVLERARSKRLDIEHWLFGYPHEIETGHNHALRPVYGYVTDYPLGRVLPSHREVWHHNPKHDGSIIVRLKPSVHTRTTVTMGHPITDVAHYGMSSPVEFLNSDWTMIDPTLSGKYPHHGPPSVVWANAQAIHDHHLLFRTGSDRTPTSAHEIVETFLRGHDHHLGAQIHPDFRANPHRPAVTLDDVDHIFFQDAIPEHLAERLKGTGITYGRASS